MRMSENEIARRYQELAQLGSLILPSRLAFAINYNLDKLRDEVERMEAERQRLCRQYADKDEKGEPVLVNSVVNGEKVQSYQMTDESRAFFEQEYRELGRAEADLEIRTAKQDTLDQCEQSGRYSVPTVAQLAALAFMIEE